MSLVQTYHNEHFGIICSDGRASGIALDGRRVAAPEIARKFVMLRRHGQDLALAGSSSVSKWLDLGIYEAARRFIENYPDACFDEVAGIIAPTVIEAEIAFRDPRRGVPSLAEMLKQPLRALLGAAKPQRAAVVNLNLLGFDRGCGRVRNRAFFFKGGECSFQEHETGITISGFFEPEEAPALSRRLFAFMGTERNPRAIVSAMLSLASELSAGRPETIGPPFFLDLVTQGTGTPRGCVIEDEFRRSLIESESRAILGPLKTGRELALRTA